MQQRWIIGIALLAGFLWVRTRAKALRDTEGGSQKALYGIFFFLAPLLFVGKWAFGFLPFGQTENLLIQLAAIGLMFGLTSILFLRKKQG